MRTIYVSKNKGSDHLRDYHTDALHLYFHIAKSRFSHDVAHFGPQYSLFGFYYPSRLFNSFQAESTKPEIPEKNQLNS